ncbi:MAG TPA: lytic transglycosylase domain-containing protein [Lacibacter sp.]|nr:lytic transglycosylase domain-containing protein [Lacibacter sp.]HMO87893.1 lytic transglycosylase domain-containing protein [Lacibacter sp.]HMP87201.1 lytic transglycosylase domain-containing protein [Lacibacter sp.]
MRPVIIFCLLLHCAGPLVAQPATGDTVVVSATDTSGGNVEKYGFKNLFTAPAFSAALPYDQQIHPQAWGFIQDYLTRHGKGLEKMKSWGTPYFTLIENVLMQYGLPRELKYLAVIESGLHTQATSWAGARGPWQLMPATARENGLQVNNWLDERTDYFRSSHAAARYLSSLYGDLKDWLLVVAAYNGGPARVQAAIRKAGSRDFWKLQYHLPEESRTHVKKFIATHYIMEGKGGVTTAGSGTPVPAIPEKTDPNIAVQTIAGKFSSVVMAKHLLVDLFYFNQLNPGFDAVLAGNQTFDLRLPKEKMERFNANRYQILSESVQLLLRFYGEEGIKEIYPKVSDLPELKKPPVQKSRKGS